MTFVLILVFTYFILTIILFQKNIHLLLLYPKHVIKLSGYNLGCYNHGEKKDKEVYVRGKWISFGREQIDQTYNLTEMKDGSKFKKLVEAPDFQKIVDLLTYGKEKWNATRKNPHESITRGALTEPAKVCFYFLCSNILPSKHLCTVREKEAVLLYAILKG